MSDHSTRVMLEAYRDEAGRSAFLSRLFKVEPRSVYNTQKIEIDVERDVEMVAGAVLDAQSKPNRNEASLFVNKTIEGIPFKEEVPFAAWDLTRRPFGESPYQVNVDVSAAMTSAVLKNAMKLGNKIRRAAELQAAQVLTTGKIENRDASWTLNDTIDFQARATHYVTVGTLWSAGSPVIVTDLDNLAIEMQKNGKYAPNALIFGTTAWRLFIQDAKIQAILDNRRIEAGGVKPSLDTNSGATYQGTFMVGAYSYECYVYNATYVTPASSTPVPYVPVNKVIMLATSARRTATFGLYPQIPGSGDVPGASYVPRVITPSMGGPENLVLQTQTYFSEDRQNLTVWAGARVLMFPTAIDCHGCLTVA